MGCGVCDCATFCESDDGWCHLLWLLSLTSKPDPKPNRNPEPKPKPEPKRDPKPEPKPKAKNNQLDM